MDSGNEKKKALPLLIKYPEMDWLRVHIWIFYRKYVVREVHIWTSYKKSMVRKLHIWTFNQKYMVRTVHIWTFSEQYVVCEVCQVCEVHLWGPYVPTKHIRQLGTLLKVSQHALLLWACVAALVLAASHGNFRSFYPIWRSLLCAWGAVQSSDQQPSTL